jgi:hypothetical protein
MSKALAVITHDFDSKRIGQRESDGYLSATDMCQGAGKLWGNYWQVDDTQACITVIAADIGIPISALVQSNKGGNDRGGLALLERA